MNTGEKKLIAFSLISGVVFLFSKMVGKRQNPEPVKLDPDEAKYNRKGVRKVQDHEEIRRVTRSKSKKLGESFIVEGITGPDRLFEREPTLDQKKSPHIAYIGPREEREPRKYRIPESNLFDVQLKFLPEKVLKAILKKFGGKKDGRSKTTDSIYGKLKDGRRVRVSTHEAVAQRSKSDIDVVFDYEKEAVYLYDKAGSQHTYEILDLSPSTTMKDVLNFVEKYAI